jgi:SAM-dependent methyltransferase
MTIYGAVKTIYRRLVPVSRRGPFHDESTRIGRTSMRLLRWLESKGTHQELYDRDYYKRLVDPGATLSADVIATSVISSFNPTSVIDVGCGSGAILKSFSERGIRAFGVDYSEAAVSLCQERGLDVVRFDLEKGLPWLGNSDVVLSTEVAEHLPEHRADAFVDLLTATAHIVVITAAIPGQGGTDHVNEQPHSYWIGKFRQRRFSLAQETVDQWRSSWSRCGVEKCYFANVLVFVKDAGHNGFW